MLGADRVIATRLEIADGKYTGEIDYYAYAETKAEAIRELAESEGYDLAHCYAYSDSVTDAPMLGTVGHPFAVNPDKDLRKLAVENEWPIRSEEHTSELQSLMRTSYAVFCLNKKT